MTRITMRVSCSRPTPSCVPNLCSVIVIEAQDMGFQAFMLLRGLVPPGPNTSDGELNLATMHRVKGLEFDAVFVASVNRGLVPLAPVIQSAADAVTRRQRENEERALLYVSLTRARKLAFVYGYGQMSEWF